MSKKNVLITGATGGIGGALCNAFSRNHNLILFGRDEMKLKKIKQNYKSVIGYYSCDISQFEEVENKLDKVFSECDNVDILINNAGTTSDSLFIRMTKDKWMDTINTNLNSNFFLTNKIAKNMLKKRWGRIINITSVVCHSGNLGQSNYTAAKAGIIGMSKSIAIELASRNITVNCISPGFIETKMTDGLSDKQKEDIINKIPMKRIGLSKDIANCAFFLASDNADYITGETIHVNGGMLMI
tara:strand:+ start:897 stop:1622 length:726 start_codon:yes stop_codon:yes gene_type:complete